MAARRERRTAGERGERSEAKSRAAMAAFLMIFLWRDQREVEFREERLQSLVSLLCTSWKRSPALPRNVVAEIVALPRGRRSLLEIVSTIGQ